MTGLHSDRIRGSTSPQHIHSLAPPQATTPGSTTNMPSYQPVNSSRPSSSSSNDSSRSRPSGGPSKFSSSRRPRLLRRLDTLFCSCITYFPLAIVYGATAWAVWVEAYSISWLSIGGPRGHFLAFVGIWLYWMLNWSYTVATFSSPGTPLETVLC